MKVATTVPPEAQDATTRQRVLTYIVQSGWTTSGRLAEEFGLTPAAIRRHLTFLETAHLLTVRTQPLSLRQQRAGRPSKEYGASTEGREAVSHSYDQVAIAAVEALRDSGGPEAVTHFFRGRFAATEAHFAAIRTANPGLTVAEALAVALTRDGFMAGLMPVRGGEQLCQHTCPYPALAERFPELCSVETGVFSRLLHSHVQRLATIAHGDGVCTTHIPTLMKEDR